MSSLAALRPALSFVLLGANALCAQSESKPETTPPATKPDAKGDGKQDAPARDDLRELARTLALAHHGQEGNLGWKSFRAGLRLEPRRDDKRTFDLDVDFKLPRAYRCTVIEKGVRAERGMDPATGPWSVSGDQVVMLEGPEHNEDADRMLGEVRMCQLLLRFLDPGKLLTSLQAPTPVQRADLKIFRESWPGCTTVEGVLDRFPTYSLGPESRARVALWVHPGTNLLLAVQIVPVDERGKPGDVAELVTLADYQKSGDIQLPTKLNIYRLTGPGRELLLTVGVKDLQLGKEFPADRFARPK